MQGAIRKKKKKKERKKKGRTPLYALLQLARIANAAFLASVRYKYKEKEKSPFTYLPFKV